MNFVADHVREFLTNLRPNTIMITGPTEKKMPGIQKAVCKFICKLFDPHDEEKKDPPQRASTPIPLASGKPTEGTDIVWRDFSDGTAIDSSLYDSDWEQADAENEEEKKKIKISAKESQGGIAGMGVVHFSPGVLTREAEMTLAQGDVISGVTKTPEGTRVFMDRRTIGDYRTVPFDRTMIHGFMEKRKRTDPIISGTQLNLKNSLPIAMDTEEWSQTRDAPLPG